ncbi:GerAB/ArcD/ProY family transporter [Gorillibacterium sp. sgz500922]|uniref:GerAB/ArcD/ProY family transporter n=1 Tax=Gorillibacterium sp. sgz500922 TaxID=3446694 RepID=UPI003F66DFEF
MTKSKLSVFQLSLLMYNTIITTALLVVPADTARRAGTDMWFCPLWSLPTGMLAFYVAYRLHDYFPGLTPIEYFPKLLGKIAGKVAGFIYVILHIFLAALVVREYAEFIIGPFLDRTPMIVVIASVLAVSGYAVYKGIPVLARLSVFFGLPLVALTLFTIVLLYPVMETRNALPIMEFGPLASLSGSYVPQGWLAEFSLAAYLLPHLPQNSKPLKALFGSVALVVGTLIAVNASSLFIFGVLTKHLSFPFLVATRFISYANFFEHVEAAAMTVWVAALVIKLSVFYFLSVSNIANWVKWTDYRPFVAPIGGVILTTSVFLAPNLETLSKFLTTVAPAIFLFFLLVAPLLFWLIAAIRLPRPQKKGATP